MEKNNDPIITKYLDELSSITERVSAHQRALEEYSAEYENIKQYGNDTNIALKSVVRNLHRKVESEKTQYAEALSKYHYLMDTFLTLNVFLSADEFNVFKLRYLENQTFQDISQKLNYSERTIYRLHNSALAKLEDVSFLF